MKVVVTVEAAEQLERQVRYLVEAHAPKAAEHLRLRVLDFLRNHLARFPKTGKQLAAGDLWETWIPATRLVIWYRLTNAELCVIAVWHASQDRS